ncbi:MAG TPA: TetR/AcrR family transcriptional regulator [Microlunatus sp.]|nr:TetR/AcrR family transcriptional regulator [Microlunatus sp.]
MARATPLPADERRAAILAATEPLVMQYGRDVSTRQIAEAAGIAEGTIFRVFPNKDAVIDAVIEDAFEGGPTLLALTEIDPSIDLGTRLEQAVEILEARMRRVISLFGAIRRLPPQPPDDPEHAAREHSAHEERRRADNARLTAALATVIGDDADRLRLPPEQAADLIRGLVFTVTHPVIGATFPSEPRVIVDTLLHGILTPTHQESTPC